jgi:hypothetical protein
MPDCFRMRHPGQVLFRRPTARHRVELIRQYLYSVEDHAHSREMPVLTLFITGPRVREWGFHCPQGFVHWKDFVHPDDPGGIGPGCGEHS